MERLARLAVAWAGESRLLVTSISCIVSDSGNMDEIQYYRVWHACWAMHPTGCWEFDPLLCFFHLRETALNKYRLLAA